MKELFETIYKKSASKRGNAVDEILDVICHLSKEKKFDTMNILFDIDFNKIDGSTLYSLCNFTSPYRNVLPGWQDFYQRAREQCARWGYPEKRINNLYDHLKVDCRGLYDPNAPPYVSYEDKNNQALNDRIAAAESAGDTQLATWLESYKAYRIRQEDRDNEFHRKSGELGDEEMRKRTIKALRDMADLLDKTAGCWPGIYYADLPDVASLREKTIDGIEVVISYPWPG